MNKGVIILDIATPFYESLIELVNKKSHKEIKLYPIVVKNFDLDRKTWGKLKSTKIFIHSKNFGIVKKIEELRPNVVFITQYNRFDTLLVIGLCLYRKIPFYLGPHEIFNNTNSFSLNLLAKIMYYKLVSFWSEGTITMGKFAVKFYNLLTQKKVYDLPYSISLDRFNLSKKQVNNEIVFLFCGRLIEFRNPLLVIKIFSKALKNTDIQSTLKLCISGEGPLENKCKQLIAKLGITSKVQWLDKIENWEEIPTIYSKIDILLALQDYSGWGMIIPEAMASEKAIISTNKMVASDSLIINGYNGYLVNVENEEAILSAMMNYVNNPCEIELHGKRSKEIIKTIDINNSVEILWDIIKKYN